MLEPLDGQLLLRSPLAQVVSDQPVVEGRVVHPFRIQLVDGVRTDVEDLSYFQDGYFGAFVLEVVFVGVVFVELLGEQFEGAFADDLLAFLELPGLQPPGLQLQQLLQFLLLSLHPLKVQLLLSLYLPPDQLQIQFLAARMLFHLPAALLCALAPLALQVYYLRRLGYAAFLFGNAFELPEVVPFH